MRPQHIAGGLKAPEKALEGVEGGSRDDAVRRLGYGRPERFGLHAVLALGVDTCHGRDSTQSVRRFFYLEKVLLNRTARQIKSQETLHRCS